MRGDAHRQYTKMSMGTYAQFVKRVGGLLSRDGIRPDRIKLEPIEA